MMIYTPPKLLSATCVRIGCDVMGDEVMRKEGSELNTFAVHDVYRRHAHLAQVMPPSIQVLLVNTKK